MPSSPTAEARNSNERKSPEQNLAETRQAEKKQRRWLLGLLAALLVGISLAAGLVLSRSWPLRGQLHQQLAWQADLARLRNELTGSASLVPAGDEKRSDLATLRRLGRLSRELAEGSGDSAVRTAAADLGERLEALEAQLAAPLSSAKGEGLADSVFATVRSADQLEAALQPQIVELYRRLDRQWAALNWLVFATLMLGASNLVFLHLAERRRRQLEAARDEAAKLVNHDSLTGLLNRDGVMRLLRHELQRCRRKKDPLGLLLADVDHFRELNVLVGEEQGDVVLQQVAKRLGGWVRPYDTMGRIGADSFLILLPGCDPLATVTVAGRLLAAVTADDVELDRSRAKVSASISHLTLDPPEDHDAELLVYRLREALDRLQAGKDRGLVEVTIDGTGPVPLAGRIQFDRGKAG
jgi:diguanylate cyclase (GGDEF)-like protein